jgi:hypothetical protein
MAQRITRVVITMDLMGMRISNDPIGAIGLGRMDIGVITEKMPAKLQTPLSQWCK